MPAMKPLIGITGRRWPAGRLANFLPSALHDAEFDLHFSEYPASIARAGGIPVELTRDAPIAECLARIDGVVISGGADVDPTNYNEAPDPELGHIEPARDAWELAVIREAMRADIPLLGICRGAQLIQVAMGGKLNQHVSRDSGDGHPRFEEPRNIACHSVTFTNGTLAHHLYGELAEVNSLHHQTLAEPAPGIVVGGVSPDGTIESIEIPNRNVFAVQWHPEMLIDHIDPSLRWIIETATKFAASSRSTNLDQTTRTKPTIDAQSTTESRLTTDTQSTIQASTGNELRN
jgi:putative glutamine amidotransferase